MQCATFLKQTSVEMDGINTVFEFVMVVKCCNILFVDQPHHCWAGGVYQACQCWAESQCWSTHQCWAGSVGEACQCWADIQCWSGMAVLIRQSVLISHTSVEQAVLIRHASVEQTGVDQTCHCWAVIVDQRHQFWAGSFDQACLCWADSQGWSATPVLNRQCLSGMPVLSRHSVLIRHASVKQTVFQRQIWCAVCWFSAHQFCGQSSKRIVVDCIHCNFLWGISRCCFG